MARHRDASSMMQLFNAAAGAGFRRAFRQVQVDERKYLRQVRQVHRLPIDSWDQMFNLGPRVVKPIAARTISSASRMAALEGAGFGLGGFLSLVPDMGVLSAITMRMVQKLSLLYGFQYSTEEETVHLWMAAASAAGLDLGRDFVGKQAMERVVPRIIDRMAVKVGSEVAEKWAGRVIPVLGAGAAGALNYYFVRGWGRRAQKHFLARHLSVIEQSPRPQQRTLSPTRLLPSTSTN